jgi:FkbM family methyltransferase
MFCLDKLSLKHKMRKLLLSFAAFAAKILPNSLKQAIYKAKPLAAFIRRGLNRAAPKGLTQVKIAAGDLAGYNILLDMQVDKDYWLGTYEPQLQEAVRELVQPGMVIYDVGANIGYVSLLLEKASGKTGKVYAFEALPDNADRWRKNMALNGMGTRPSLFAGAVTQTAGPVQFMVHPSGGMGKVAGSAGRQDQYLSEITVPGISLDEFVYEQGNPPPQVVKMDIEGGEVLALPGMQRVLTEARPLMLIELHGPASSQVAWETLTAAGYQICWMQHGYPEIPSLEAMGWKAYIIARPKK